MSETVVAGPPSRALLEPTDTFLRRHLGPSSQETEGMLRALGESSLNNFIDKVVPEDIRMREPLHLAGLEIPMGEAQVLGRLRAIMSRNDIYRSYLGMGYHGTDTPNVILRNILENPGWYTAYTPYQAEIAQGRLEALLNFQTMVCDLTGMDIANASLLDEGTAAAEAVAMAYAKRKNNTARTVFIADNAHPQTIDVVRTRAEPLGLTLINGPIENCPLDDSLVAVILQYPGTDGVITNHGRLIENVHQAGGMAIVAADILSLVVLEAPASVGADVVVGSTQRFGVPMGYGGPHAAYFATRDEYKRVMPGRLVGISKDAAGNPGYRLTLQTREQHIRRDRATSNICTAQVLLAVIASMYAVYHGPDGLRQIASRVHRLTRVLAEGLKQLGFDLAHDSFFDTLRVRLAGGQADAVITKAREHRVNLRRLEDDVCVALDETVTETDLATLLLIFAQTTSQTPPLVSEIADELDGSPAYAEHARNDDILTHPVFHSHHTETDMLRYLKRLENRDISLTHSMIPLGSCTMKLNSTTEMIPVTWPEVGHLHPFAPVEQAAGYQELFAQLEAWLAEITGFAAVSLQPNAGSQGEFAGLLAIRDYHRARGDQNRDVCLIPVSAHGTNPASAVMAGFRVVSIECGDDGNINMADLRVKAGQYRDQLGAIMITYPSTHGVFETTIREVADIVHQHGGQVYMDGANLTAQVGLCRPGDFGMDVCHLNLHKTFCIPHGGGGPGVGPIAVADHLKPFLPGHPVLPPGTGRTECAISAAPWGSASILVISWTYIAMLGAKGLTEATKTAILNANYIAQRIDSFFPVLYKGTSGQVAHECIIDFRDWKKRAGIEVEDVAKRLMDYGFHAPTMSWPVAGTMMIEPTESESKAELDRFCDALAAIHEEMNEVARCEADRDDNLLKNAPHTCQAVSADNWKHNYSRERAAFPLPYLREYKYWPPVSRIDNVYGDRNVVCSCPPMAELAESP